MKALAFLLLFCASPLSSQTEQTQTGSRFGQRPKNSIFDPNGILTIKQTAQIAEPLAKVLKEESIDVMVVILPTIRDTPPQHVAMKFAEKWALTRVNAVILHVPDKVGSPWIFPGHFMREMLPPDKLSKSIAAAEKRAAIELTDYGKVRTAATETSDLLRYEIGGAFIKTEGIMSAANKRQFDSYNRQRILKIVAILSLAAFIPLISILVYIRFRYSRSKPKFFPSVRLTKRLGAPYSGGNNALLKQFSSRL